MERPENTEKLIEENKRLKERVSELESLEDGYIREKDLLLSIFEATSPLTGEDFMRSLTRSLATVLKVRYTLIGEVIDNRRRIRTLALWANGEFAPNLIYELEGTPYDNVVNQTMRYYPYDVQKLFPADATLVEMGVESYLGVPLFDSQGNPRGVLAALHDKPIEDEENAKTLLKFFAVRAGVELERKRTVDALRESEEKYRRIIETANIGVWAIDGNLRTTYVNKVMAGMLGYGVEEMTGRPVFDFMDEEQRKVAEVNMEKRRKGVAEQLDFRFRRKDGTFVWTLLSSAPVFDKEGRFAGVLAMVRDISKRKLADEALMRSEASLANAQRIARIGNWEWDIVNNELHWSDEIYRIFGVAPREFGATHDAFLGYVHPDDREFVRRSVDDALHGRKPYSIDHRIVQPDHTVKFVHEQGETVFDEAGKPLKMYGTAQDVTELKLAEKELLKYRDRLEEIVEDRTAELRNVNLRLEQEINVRKKAEEEIKKLNRELEEKVLQLENINRELEAFDYSLAHDLGAPLRVIDGFSRLLLKHYSGRVDSEGRHFIETIRENTLKMDRFILDLLNLARLGRREIRFSEIDMRELAKSVFEELRQTAKERTIDFRVTELPPAKGERTLLKQVFANLLSNAIKFTGPREIAVIEVGGRAEENEKIYYVKDNGVGFDMAHRDRLFKVFKRLHTEREFEGTGAGLAIVKRIIERHGGKVWAEGRVDEGATFYFAIPEAAGSEKHGSDRKSAKKRTNAA